MTIRWAPAIGVTPVFVYGVWLMATGVTGWSGLAFVAALLTALPLFGLYAPERVLYLLAPGFALGVLVSLDAWLTGSVPVGTAAALGSGLLLGLPAFFLGATVALSERPGVALLALSEGLVEIVGAQAAIQRAGSGVSASGFLAAYFEVADAQVVAFSTGIAHLGLRSPITFPLAAWVDPTFIVLAVLALGGILVPLLRPPRAGVGTPARPPRRDLAAPVRMIPPPVLNAPDIVATPPRAALGSGLAPVVGAVGAVAAFEAVGAEEPAYAFLAVTVGAIAILIVIAVLSRVPRSVPVPRAAKAAPAPPSGPAR